MGSVVAQPRALRQVLGALLRVDAARRREGDEGGVGDADRRAGLSGGFPRSGEEPEVPDSGGDEA